MAFIAIEASITSFWNSLFTAPLIKHLRAGSVSLITYVADCVLFSFQGAQLGILSNSFAWCVPNDALYIMYITVSFDTRQYLPLAFSYHLI